MGVSKEVKWVDNLNEKSSIKWSLPQTRGKKNNHAGCKGPVKWKIMSPKIGESVRGVKGTLGEKDFPAGGENT